MKFIVGIDKYDYSFSPSTDQFTITGLKSGGGGLKVEQIVLVTNITDNAIIYNFAGGNSNNGITAGSESSGNQTFTLGFDCTAMSNSDKLQIIVQDETAPAYAIINEPFDKVDVTYVAAGNGEGEINTITYKLGATTVATLTLTYNSDDQLTNITRT